MQTSLRETVLLAFLLLISAAPVRAEAPAWVRRFGPQAGGDDYAQKIVVDHGGKVILAGYTRSGTAGYDMLVIKYSGAGMPLWTNRYNGPADGADYVTGVAVDGNDSVFVTGYSDGGMSGYDYATLAYSSAGVPLWTNRYNGTGNSTDWANAIAADGGGNVYVTGYSLDSSAYADYLTIAYSGAGVPLWTNRFSGPQYSDNYAQAIVVDNSGNVIVAGSSGANFATLAYSSAGVPLWTNFYHGPSSSWGDSALAIAADDAGNTFVTGYSARNNNPYSDYATIAYSHTGAPLWTNRYSLAGNGSHSAQAIALGGGGVYVTGHSYNSGTGYDYLTIAYSSAGVPSWTNRYNGPGNTNDYAQAIAVDSNSGNVYVTGYSKGLGTGNDYATVAYSSEGVPLWTNRYDGPGGTNDIAQAIVLDAGGNVYVTGYSYGGGSTGNDVATLAYSSAGLPLWTNCYDGLAANSQPSAVAVDSSGNIYVTGYSYRNGGYDYATVAYSSVGVPLWTNYYNGPGNGTDQAKAIALDHNRNVYVTGTSAGATNGPDYATLAYSSTGVPLWTNRYTGPFNYSDSANAIAVDGSSNVYVTGYSDSGTSSGQYDYVTLAYSIVGVPVWTNRYNGPGNGSDTAVAIALDGQGRVYVTGSSMGNTTSADYATIAYSKTGVALWTNRYATADRDYPYAMTVSEAGDVYVTGASGTLAYSSAGMALWTNVYYGRGNAITMDDGGNIYVAGYPYGKSASGYDYATVAYSSAGSPLWTNLYNGPGNTNDYAQAIAVDGNAVYVTGYSMGDGSAYDLATIGYTGAGVPFWTNRYSGPANGNDKILTSHCLAVAPDGSVIVAGASDGDLWTATCEYALVKYVVPPVIVAQPTNCAVLPGGSAVFAVTVAGTRPLSFRWQKDGADLADSDGLSGSGTNLLTLSNVTADQMGRYSVVVTNASGQAPSLAANLAVMTRPELGQLTQLPDGTVQFTVTGTSNVIWRIEGAASLQPPIHWEPVTNVTILGDLIRFSDPGAMNCSQRFYRAVWP